MRALGTAVQNRTSANEDEIAIEKLTFESNKTELEQLLRNVQVELDNTDMDVIRKGPKFMEQGGKQDHARSKDKSIDRTIGLLQNIFAAQARTLSPRKGKKEKPVRLPKLVNFGTQTQENKEATSLPIVAANIKHYKPQELIRLELENTQMREEMETMREYTEELQARIDRLIKCISETNTNKFLGEC